MQEVELTIKRKAGIEKKIISDNGITAGLIDLVAAANETNLDPGEFIACYAMLTSEIDREAKNV